MSEEPKKDYYTWAKFNADAKKIAAWAKSNNLKSVYGVPRGGLVLAVALSHLLDVPLILARDDITRDTLIVDDIIDEGGTMERLMSTLGHDFRVASIFFNPDSRYTPQFFARKKKYWVIFPWETNATSRYDQTI